MDEIIKVKVEEIVIVAPDKVELATPKITTDGKNIVATQSQQGGYVPTEEKTAIIPATSLDADLRPENIVKGVSIFGIEGTKEFKKQTKNINITQNGTETVQADEGYGMEAVVIETNVQPALQEKEITENGDYEADDGYYGLSVIKVNVQPVLQEKTTTENGAVEADDGFYGLKKVVVDVNPPLQKKALTATQNGTQTIKADEGNYGLEVVNVQPELQKKTVNINVNGTQTVTPDEAVYGLEEVEIAVNIQPKLQSKNVTENGTVAPDEGYDGLSEVVVDINPALQEKEVTENGEVVADEGFYGLKKVNVNVNPALQEKTAEVTENGITEITVDEGYDGITKVSINANVDLLYKMLSDELETYENNNVTKIKDYLFHSCTNLKAVNLPNVTEIGQYAFYGCNGIESFNFNNVETIKTYAFYGALNGDISLPKMQSLSSSYSFASSGITSIKIDNCIYIYANCFADATKLEIVDIGGADPIKEAGKTTGISSNAFKNCTALKKVILRMTTWQPSITTNTFSGSAIAKGTGFIYVPDELVDTYKSATNWATYASQIKPISELEQ